MTSQNAAPTRPRPIFVIGRHRSGTTWLSNVLTSSGDVYAPRHELHKGVHESAFFSHLVPYCNHGRTAIDLLAIKHLFESCDFFRLTGLESGPDILDQGFVGYFRAVMDAAAQRAGAKNWLEKTPLNTLQAGWIARTFADAVLIAVVRDHRAVVASNVYGFGVPGSPRHWLWQAVATAAYERVALRHAHIVIRYEDLVSDYEGTIRKLFGQLGLDTSVIPRSPYESNSSFAGAKPGPRAWQTLLMTIGRGLVALLPAGLLERIVVAWCRHRRGRLPRWFFLLQHGLQPAGRLRASGEAGRNGAR